MSLVVALNGPVNSGKSTVGRALAARLGARFIDGDDHGCPDGVALADKWAAALDRVVREVAGAGPDGLVVAYPLDQAGHDRIAAACPGPLLVATLAPSLAVALSDRGDRRLTEWERQRIRAMYRDGYHRRSFSQVELDTGRLDVAGCVAALLASARDARCHTALSHSSPSPNGRGPG